MKNLELPEPANKLWRKTRDTIGDLGLGERAMKTRLGGGTILAARWKHRISTDIDVRITGTTDLTEIRKGREGDLAQRLGGKWELDARNQVRVRLEDGVIDVSTVRTQPNRGAYDVLQSRRSDVARDRSAPPDRGRVSAPVGGRRVFVHRTRPASLRSDR